jgi:hypothetical protein
LIKPAVKQVINAARQNLSISAPLTPLISRIRGKLVQIGSQMTCVAALGVQRR